MGAAARRVALCEFRNREIDHEKRRRQKLARPKGAREGNRSIHGRGGSVWRGPEALSARPAFVDSLERSYGPPSRAGFGSAVFWVSGADASLEDQARACYRRFVGELWERWGEAAWMGPWREVYARPADAPGDVVSELRALEQGAASSANLILDPAGGAEAARAALAAAFDDPAVQALKVFNLGDGEAVSGLLVAARVDPPAGDLFLAFLMD